MEDGPDVAAKNLLTLFVTWEEEDHECVKSMLEEAETFKADNKDDAWAQSQLCHIVRKVLGGVDDGDTETEAETVKVEGSTDE